MRPSRQSDYRSARYSAKRSINMPVDMGAFNDVIAGVEGDVEAALRPAVQAGAEVLYQAALKNVAAIGKVSGRLGDSIYQAFSLENSTVTPGGYSRVTYHVSWNARKAPHGHLIEFGHIQRYAVHLGDDGKWHTLVRPLMRGKPRPKRGASQAEKDAYYIPRSGGPRQIAAQPFIRPVFYRQGQAIAAVEDRFWQELGGRR